jgi:tyrosyl-tRNA synthetase
MEKTDTPDIPSFESGILRELRWRGFLYQWTHDEELDELLASPTTLYCGFDPTSDSLHVGSLMPLMLLAFFRRHGHDPIALVGGATGMIGDPSGKSEERTLMTPEKLEHNVAGVREQMRTILDRALELHPETLPEGVEPGAEADDEIPILDNSEWIAPWSYIDFLRDIGKDFRVNHMINKDSVRSRLEDREQGISYTEFSYMLIQAYDFYHLFEERDCPLQVGGSDQWGNITAGTELIRRKLGEAAFGLTFPLLTMASGEKFGKTAGGAVWLDAGRTSPYQFYQYWVRRPDEEVGALLRTFTFLPSDEIEELEALIESGENRWDAQQKLAWEVTSLVHGVEETERVIRASKVLYGEPLEGLDDSDLEAIRTEVDSTRVERGRLEGEGLALLDLFEETGLQRSKSAARRLVKNNGAYLNNERITDIDYRVTVDDLATESMLLLRSGKKNYHLVKVA